MVVRPAVNRMVAGSSPAWAARGYHRPSASSPQVRGVTAASWFPSPAVRVQILPHLLDKGVLLGEQAASKTGADSSTPSALAGLVPDAPVAEWSRHHFAKVDRRVRLPPGALRCPVMKLACQPVRLTGETGSIPVQGANPRAVAERRGDRLIRGGRQVRLLPARLTGEWTGAVPAGFHVPSEVGSTPASPT